MILQKHVLSFKCNDFFKLANLKAISSSATLTMQDKRIPVSHKELFQLPAPSQWVIEMMI